MVPFKESEIVFKLKNLNDDRSKGARCDQAGRKVVDKLFSQYFSDIKLGKSTSQQQCVELEILMRFYDIEKKQNLRWFFNTEDTILNEVEIKNK